MGDLESLARQAFATITAVSDDPEARYALRVRFYDKYAFADDGAGYGNSELAFMRWEIERGVLAPLDAARPGSRWWRDVNASLMFDAELAALIYESGEPFAAPPGARRWLDYLRAPSEQSWYVAHNGSIVAGYLAQTAAARAELDGEQRFMNIVLYRVLYAEAMVSGATFLGRLGELLADPVLPSVNLIVDVKDFYPRDYPLTRADVRNMLGRGDSILDLAVRIFDDDLIMPEAASVYGHAATSLGIPELGALLRDGKPSYPLAP
ncbi:MAG: hypothetical protein JWM53_6571 [bacterium]|nr:hypothetical protein [bacterium]